MTKAALISFRWSKYPAHNTRIYFSVFCLTLMCYVCVWGARSYFIQSRTKQLMRSILTFFLRVFIRKTVFVLNWFTYFILHGPPTACAYALLLNICYILDLYFWWTSVRVKLLIGTPCSLPNSGYIFTFRRSHYHRHFIIGNSITQRVQCTAFAKIL